MSILATYDNTGQGLYISKCEVCLSHRTVPPREPLQQRDFVARPWSKIGADLCQIDSHTLLVVTTTATSLK